MANWCKCLFNRPCDRCYVTLDLVHYGDCGRARQIEIKETLLRIAECAQQLQTTRTQDLVAVQQSLLLRLELLRK